MNRAFSIACITAIAMAGCDDEDTKAEEMAYFLES